MAAVLMGGGFCLGTCVLPEDNCLATFFVGEVGFRVVVGLVELLFLWFTALFSCSVSPYSQNEIKLETLVVNCTRHQTTISFY